VFLVLDRDVAVSDKRDHLASNIVMIEMIEPKAVEEELQRSRAAGIGRRASRLAAERARQDDGRHGVDGVKVVDRSAGGIEGAPERRRIERPQFRPELADDAKLERGEVRSRGVLDCRSHFSTSPPDSLAGRS
jgi:hypothetical protein